MPIDEKGTEKTATMELTLEELALVVTAANIAHTRRPGKAWQRVFEKATAAMRTLLPRADEIADEVLG